MMETTKIYNLLLEIENMDKIASEYIVMEGRYSFGRILSEIDRRLTNRLLRQQLQFDLATFLKSPQSKSAKEKDLFSMLITTVNTIIDKHPEVLIGLFIQGLGHSKARPNSFYTNLYNLCSPVYHGGVHKFRVHRALLKLVIMNKVNRMEHLINGGRDEYYEMPDFKSVIESDGSSRRSIYFMSRFLEIDPVPEFKVEKSQNLGFLASISSEPFLAIGSWWIGNKAVTQKEITEKLMWEYIRITNEVETAISGKVSNYYESAAGFFDKVVRPIGGSEHDHFSEEYGSDMADGIRTIGEASFSINSKRAVKSVFNWYQEQIIHRYNPT